MNCVHCYQENIPRIDLSEMQIESVLNSFKECLNNSPDINFARSDRIQLNITGGEPFYVSYFPKLIEKISACSDWINFGILCNGTLIDNEVAVFLKRRNIRFVQVSIDGDEEIHDQIRGKGSFNKSLKGLEILRKNNIFSMVSFTANRKNYQTFPAVVKASSSIGVNKVWADRIVPIGNAESNNMQTLSEMETEDFFRIMRNEKMRLQKSWFTKTTVSMRRALQFHYAELPPYKCTAAKRLLALMPDGTVFPCRRYPVAIGNIFTEPLSNIRKNGINIMSLSSKDIAGTNCEHCRYKIHCAGGARCISYAVNPGKYSPDPGCWIGRQGNDKERSV
ncbi:MAG: radical SAM protein [Candidatus Riflebacteria bacterium]|nr:radical SAM protein [Candidatus Riflebacteria bacterium]